MNIRKVLLATLILAIVSLGLTLTGCEKKGEQPGEQPKTEAEATCPKCGEVAGSEACCMTKAAKEAGEDVKDAAAEHPTEHPK